MWNSSSQQVFNYWMVKQFDEISVDTVLVIKYRLSVTVVVGKRGKKLLRNVRKDYEKLTGICCVLLLTT